MRSQAEGILGGAEVEGGILWCVTELVSKAQLDAVPLLS